MSGRFLMPDPKNLVFPTVRSHHHFYDLGIYFMNMAMRNMSWKKKKIKAEATGTVILALRINERCA